MQQHWRVAASAEALSLLEREAAVGRRLARSDAEPIADLLIEAGPDAGDPGVQEALEGEPGTAGDRPCRVDLDRFDVEDG